MHKKVLKEAMLTARSVKFITSIFQEVLSRNGSQIQSSSLWHNLLVSQDQTLNQVVGYQMVISFLLREKESKFTLSFGMGAAHSWPDFPGKYFWSHTWVNLLIQVSAVIIVGATEKSQALWPSCYWRWPNVWIFWCWKKYFCSLEMEILRR